ncbi:hypothetical protein BJ138DRAFT_1138637 [Hygrophoropsis aurantiaca]|uniref:Uncharacterized protein n=1 Tax=Hygrophoropsis aurantiaca TaxID=72124 RepID=A0ACB7ZTF6_9AGAM|nr:hypothetical protein BJ138DRAFT_1138637 [Hygrophoropsis aurantiaca]
MPSSSQHRSVSLPPPSSDGPIASSPVIGNKSERMKIKAQKSQRKRKNTIAKQKQVNLANKIAEEKELADAAQKREEIRLRALQNSLDALTSCGLTFGDLMIHVFDPRFKQGVHHWDGFFKVSKKNSLTAQTEVQEWAVEHVCNTARREARVVTASGYLQSKHRTLDASYFLRFNLDVIYNHLCGAATFATSARHLKSAGLARMCKKSMVISAAAVQLLGEYSYGNDFLKRVMGIYMYATGAQRQAISVMARLGLSESYVGIVMKKRVRPPKNPTIPIPPPAETQQQMQDPPDISTSAAHPSLPPVYWKPGTLPLLSDAMRNAARTVAATGLFGTVYDNINMMFRIAEQIVGRTDSQENGTCATIWPLWKARVEDMAVGDFEKTFDQAPPLNIDDILLTPSESDTFEKCLVHCILRIIINHGGDKFQQFRKDLESSQPETDQKIEVHETPLHPLPAMNIDESTIVGNGEVVEAVLDELRVKESLSEQVKFFAGDQLSIARLRTLANIRAGQEGGFAGFGWGAWIPGLFHAKIADMHDFLVTHWGKPNAGTRNPGCLAFHNTRLHRNPIMLSSLPSFRVCRDLVFVSLYSRILHCLLLVSGKDTLEDYIDSCEDWDTLRRDARTIFEKYANSDIVEDLRWQRKMANPKTELQGDMVFENAVLFLHDGLISREFTDAVKSGDSGCVVLVLKTWALAFRGNRRTKYAHEMLHFIHNLSHVWPKSIRSIVLNWLLNPTGRPNSFVEVDLVQEHMNFWNFYQAHGSAASWTWLEMIVPCVQVLRHVSRGITSQFGATSGHPF